MSDQSKIEVARRINLALAKSMADASALLYARGMEKLRRYAADAGLDLDAVEPEPDYEALGYPETNVGFEGQYLGPTMTDLIETLHVCVECAVAASPIKENDEDTDKG